MTGLLTDRMVMKNSSSDHPRVRLWFSAALLACLLTIISAHGQSIVQSWEGIRGPDPSGTVGPPPDPHGAPGPAGVIATVNLGISYYTKSGALIWGPTNLPTFFTGNTGTGNQNADPRTIFDQVSRRFFVIMQENHNSTFWLNVAVSRNSDPRSSGAADWITYRLNATKLAAANAAGGVNYGGDYPGLAVDEQALYVTYNLFPLNASGVLAGSATNAVLLIVNKAQLIAGNGTLASLEFNASTLQPATPRGQSAGNVVYLVANGSSSNLNLFAVNDPQGARTVAAQIIPINDVGAGPTNKAPQLGSAFPIDTLAGRMQGNATLANGDLWCCMTRGQPAGPALAAYCRLQLNGWPFSGNNPALGEEGTVGALTDWNYLPSIGANLAGDVAITWTRSSSTRAAAMMVAWRTANVSTFGAPNVVRTSQTPAIDLDNTGTFSRWGDYFSVWPDPIDGSLWADSEWTRADTGTWSTWWAQISMPGRDFYVNRNAPSPGQDGSLAHPYKTVDAAHAYITSGTLHIFGGTYNERLTLNKAVTLEAYSGGPVTIGAP